MSTVVVGAGPAGLAVASALARRAHRATVLERASVGASWRGHYDRLHLHTTRRLSFLGGSPIPRRYGRWVARDDVVAYLDEMAHDLRVRPGVTVERVDPDGPGWVLSTSAGPVPARDVVIATGYNHTPLAPSWPGVDGYTGELLHAADYRSGAPFAGRDVLVVGVGNTGAEIAVDLVESGARSVRLAVRTPPHIVRRSTLGWPAQGTGMVVRHLPVPVVDVVARGLARVEVPDLSSYGLPRPTTGLYSRMLEGATPVQDVGLIAAVRDGAVTPVAAVVGIEGDEVLLADGTRLRPEVIVAATGYRRDLEPLVGHLGVLDERGLPRSHGARAPRPGLYLTGFTTPISGMLRELRLDAERIARAIA